MPIKINRQGGIGKHNIDSSIYHTGLSGNLTNNLMSIDETGLPKNSGYGIETVLSGTPNKIPTSDAVKTYVDDVIPSYDALIYKGAIDCSTNPNYPAADCGWLYKISVAGRIGGSSGKVVEVNDIAICTQDSTPSGDEASVGAYWDVIQANIVRALLSPEVSIDNRIIVYSGTSGLVARDSGYLAQDATTSQKGFTQLSNSYMGILETVSVTEKALSDGLALKQNSLTSGDLTEINSSVLIINSGTQAVLGEGVSIEVKKSSNIQDGYLSSSDFTNFNNKQNSISSGNLTVSTPLHQTGGEHSVIGSGVSITIDEASISQKGVTQLSNSYSGSLETKAVTEKALSDGLALKSNILTSGNLTEQSSSVLIITNGENSVLGSGTLIEVKKATSIQNGYLSSEDFVIFNNKQSSISSGNLSVASPLHQTGGENSIIGSGVSISIDDASTSQKGVSQLSNSYSGSLENKAVTEKALSDGLTLKQNTMTSGNLTGTSNQIIVSNGANAVIGSGVVLSLPQDIAPASSPVFNQLSLSSTPTESYHATTKSYVDLQDSVLPLITHEPTGFESRTTSSMSFNSGTLAFTIIPSGALTFNIWSQGVKYEKGESSTTIDNIKGLWFIYYNTSGVLTRSQTIWTFVDGNIPVATVYWDNTTSTGIVSDERHGIIMDGMTHGYLHYAIGVRYISGLTGTFTNTTFSTTSGVIYDEDIRFVIPAQTQCRVFYRESGFYKFTSPQTKWYVESGGILQYDNAGVLTPVDNNKYIAMWVFATNDIHYPIHVLVGQNQSTTLADARSVNTYEGLSLLALPSQEMKAIYRVIVRRNGTSEEYVETQDLRSVSNLPAGTYVATSHGILTGLTNDDHTQYLLANGTRALTADWDAGSYEIRAQTFESDIASGTAPLTIASPTRVDNLNVQYLNGKQDSDFANSSHTHNHNDTTNIQGGTSGERFHLTSGQAVVATQQATNSQDGYLTSEDWSTFNDKLDSLTSGNLTESTSSVLTILGGTGAVIGTGVSIQVERASSEQDGYLASLDFTTFNNKQNQLSSGNLIASSPLQIDNGVNAIIGANRTLSVQDASISQKGATQLSNSYVGTSQILAVTEKALSDGLGTKQNTLTNPIIGTGTSGQLAQFIGATSVIGVTANFPDNNAIHDNVSGELSVITEKTIPVINDILLIEDSADSYNKKKLTVENLLTTRLGIESRITIANNSTDSEHDIDFSAGWMYDSSGEYLLSKSLTVKRIDASWSAGDGNGGLFSGSVAANTWYYCFIIRKTADGTIDAGFDVSSVAANIPSGYSAYRRVGAILTDSSSNITQFYQINERFYLKTPAVAFSTDNPGTNAVLSAVVCPPLHVAMVNCMIKSWDQNTVYAMITSPSQTDSTPSASLFTQMYYAAIFAPATYNDGMYQEIYTDSSSRIRYRLSATHANIGIRVMSLGWFDIGI